MPDQKNLILAIVLSVAILGAFQFFYEAPRLEREAAQQQAAQQQAEAQGQTPPVGVQTPSGGAPVTVPGSTAAAGGTGLSRADLLAQSPRVKIESDRLNGSIALSGGRIDDLILNGYKVTVDAGSPDVTLLSPVGTADPYYADFGWIPVAGTSAKLPGADTVWRSDSTVLSPDRPVTLTWDNGEGLRFSRTYTLDENYMFTVDQRVENNSADAVALYPYGLISRHNTPYTLGFFILHEGPLGVFDETLEEVDYDDLQDESPAKLQRTSTGGWIGITDKYWLTALVPDQKTAITASFNHQLAATDKYQVDYFRNPIQIPAGGSAEVTDRLFAGAKEVSLINAYQQDLGIVNFDLAIDWGWFPFLTKPLFIAIDYFYHLLGNFGLSIIVVTVIIKFLFLPLAYKSYVSMSQMKKLQPEMVKLRERFGDDRQKLNQEMMELYKRQKVNPVSGCLPMLLQIPVFFALYKVLFVTIEMRHQPFYGWIKDLSAPDPTSLFNAFGLIPLTLPDFMLIGIWPILMGITMFLQQKLNPQPADPVQAKVFMFMPLFFTFLLARFPAGLVIYWTVNNVLTIGQQWLIMKRSGT